MSDMSDMSDFLEERKGGQRGAVGLGIRLLK